MSIQPGEASQSFFHLRRFSLSPSSELTQEEINTSSSQQTSPIIDENASKALVLFSENSDKDMSMPIEEGSQSASNPISLSFWNWSNWGITKIKNLFSNESESQSDILDIDCTIPKNAFEVLGLSAEEAADKEVLDKRYEDLYQLLNRRLLKAINLKSKPVAKEIQKVVDLVHQSYHTLTR